MSQGEWEKATESNREGKGCLLSIWWQPGHRPSVQPGQIIVTAGSTAAYLAIKLRQWPASLPSNSLMSGIKISLTRVTSETQRAASSSFIFLHNTAKDSGLHRGGAALLTCPAAPRRPSGLVVKRPLEKNCECLSLSRLSARLGSTDFSPLSTRPGETPQQKPFICCTVHAKWPAFLFTSCFVSRICLSVSAITSLLREEWFQCSWGFLRLPIRSD